MARCQGTRASGSYPVLSTSVSMGGGYYMLAPVGGVNSDAVPRPSGRFPSAYERVETHQRHAPPSPRLVGDAHRSDVRAPGEELKDASAQRAGALAMHHLDVEHTRRSALGEVAIEEGLDVLRAEEVQVEPAVQGQRDHLISVVLGRHQGATFLEEEGLAVSRWRVRRGSAPA